MKNESLETYSVLENSEYHKEIIQKLEEQNIRFSEMLEFEFEVLKSLLEEFDELLIKSFWEEIQNYKNSKIIDKIVIISFI